MIGKKKILPVCKICYPKLHKTNPLAGSNSGIYIGAIRAIVLKQLARNTKIRAIIPI